MLNMKYNPVKNYKQELYPNGDVTQWYGENPALYAYMGIDGHNGIDIVRAHGENMYAIEDATVLEVNNTPNGYGKHLRLLSKESTNGVYNKWTYGHCSAIIVEVGQEVRGGELIAYMGNTGFVVSGATPYWKNNPYAGTHLHLGLRKVTLSDKGWSYPKSKIKLRVQDYSNGFKGSIDPSPYLENLRDNVSQTTIKEMKLTLVSLQKTLISLLKKELQKLLTKREDSQYSK